MNNFGEKVNFIWSVADLIRDAFKRGEYQDVILPFTVLRRIDAVLEPTKEAVRKANKDAEKRGLANREDRLKRIAGYAFYNTSQYDFKGLVDDSKDLSANLRHYINGFSDNMRDVLLRFNFDNIIERLEDAGLLYKVMESFKTIDLHPDSVSNLEMGYIFEELIRKFNEALNENPGEHFTPREVIELMVELLLASDEEKLHVAGTLSLVYDPCCGSGGMLTVARDRIETINPEAQVRLYGQEVNPKTWAMCKSDMYFKSLDGTDAENIKLGSTLRADLHPNIRFDYMIVNPPYGKDWKQDKEDVEKAAKQGKQGRFPAGTPRISDGQLLFLQHMISKMRSPDDGGSRIAIVMNGSPLFTGDAGSGESEIRRYILENDLLEVIVALPEQLFYNTGISTYIWILSNRKADNRKHKVQLIDASSFWESMRKSLGSKRREISPEKRADILELYQQYADADETYSRIFDTIDFGYRRVTIDRPLKLNFQASAERIERLKDETAFKNLAKSRKRDKAEKQAEIDAGIALQEQILSILDEMDGQLYKSRKQFLKDLRSALKAHDLKVKKPIETAILRALSEKDDTAEICRDKKGNPEPDSDLRDYEYVPLDYSDDYDPLRYERVPLKENIYDYFQREVQPYFPDGEVWINTDSAHRDDQNDKVGKVGYEINFNRYFYQYEPPRPLHEIEADIKALETDILRMLGEVTG